MSDTEQKPSLPEGEAKPPLEIREIDPKIGDDLAWRANVANKPGQRRWLPHGLVMVRLIGGSPDLRHRIIHLSSPVIHAFGGWVKFSDSPFAKVRVALGDPTSWSFHGTDATSVAWDQPTAGLAVSDETSDTELTEVLRHLFDAAVNVH